MNRNFRNIAQFRVPFDFRIIVNLKLHLQDVLVKKTKRRQKSTKKEVTPEEKEKYFFMTKVSNKYVTYGGELTFELLPKFVLSPQIAL